MFWKDALLFHGMKRSGNHVVINWILSGGSFAFHNNVLPFDRYHGAVGIPFRRLAPAILWKEVRRGSWRASRRIISLEDTPITTPALPGGPARTRNVLIVRAPANLFASRIRKASSTEKSAYSLAPANLHRTAELWKEHAREVLRITDYLDDPVRIYFDRWLSDATYRQLLAAEIDIVPDDKTLDHVATQGGGSSFGIKASIGDRPALLTEDEATLLDRLMADEEIRQLAEALAAQPLNPR